MSTLFGDDHDGYDSEIQNIHGKTEIITQNIEKFI